MMSCIRPKNVWSNTFSLNSIKSWTMIFSWNIKTRYNRIFMLKPTQLQQRPKVICQACTGNDNNESCLGAHINQRNKWFYINDQCDAVWLFVYTIVSMYIFYYFLGILIDYIRISCFFTLEHALTQYSIKLCMQIICIHF